MHRLEPFEQLSKSAIDGSYLPCLVKIQSVVYEMFFEAFVDDGYPTNTKSHLEHLVTF